jgi:hypothetical protein
VREPSSSVKFSPKDVYDAGPYPAGTPAMAAALAELFRDTAVGKSGASLDRPLLRVETNRAIAGLATSNVVMVVPAVEGRGVGRGRYDGLPLPEWP